MLSAGTIGHTNMIAPQSKAGVALYIGNTVVGGLGNHILSGTVSTIGGGAMNKIVGQPFFTVKRGKQMVH